MNRIRAPHFALLAIAILYVVGLIAMPPEGLTHHDTGAKYLQVRNLRLTPTGLDYSINYPARTLDPDLDFVPFREKQFFIDRTDPDYGLIYLQWPIFLGLLTRLPWKILGFWGLYVVPILAGIGTCWATYRLALTLDAPRRIAWVVAPLVGLATPLSIYSLLFFEHTLAAMLVALSLIFAIKAIPKAAEGDTRQESQPLLRRIMSTVKRPIVVSGIFLSVAVYFRSELYVLAAVTGFVYFLLALRWREWRGRLVAWVIAFLVALLPLWAFYAITEGTLLPLHATWYFAGSSSVGEAAPGPTGGFELPALRYIVNAGWGIIPDFLFGPQTFPSSPIYPLWVGVVGVGGIALCAIASLGRGLTRKWNAIGSNWQPWVFVIGLVGVCVASLTIALLPDPYHNLHGFVLASPFIALALWPPDIIIGKDGITKHGLIYTITLAHIALHALIISALSGLGPISRHEWGQRYLLSAYPALVVLALLTVSRFRLADFSLRMNSRVLRGALATLIGLLVAIGLLFTARGYVVLYSEKTQVKSWQDLAASLPANEPIVTDQWWLPLNLSPVFYTRPIMLASGYDRLAKWAAQMQRHNLQSFAFMSDKPAIFASTWRAGFPTLQPVGDPVELRGIYLQQFRFDAP